MIHVVESDTGSVFGQSLAIWLYKNIALIMMPFSELVNVFRLIASFMQKEHPMRPGSDVQGGKSGLCGGHTPHISEPVKNCFIFTIIGRKTKNQSRKIYKRPSITHQTKNSLTFLPIRTMMKIGPVQLECPLPHQKLDVRPCLCSTSYAL